MTKQKSFGSVVFLLTISTLVLSGCSSQPESFPIGSFKSVGSYYIDYFNDGTFTFGFQKDEPLVKGQYGVDGNTITFHSETMMDGAPSECTGEGSYIWDFEDNVLVMEIERDPCDLRAHQIDGVEYSPIEE